VRTTTVVFVGYLVVIAIVLAAIFVIGWMQR
jgi:hypothetical protein